MQPPWIPSGRFRQQGQKAGIIVGGPKNDASLIPPAGQVVLSPHLLHSYRPGHGLLSSLWLSFS